MPEPYYRYGKKEIKLRLDETLKCVYPAKEKSVMDLASAVHQIQDCTCKCLGHREVLVSGKEAVLDSLQERGEVGSVKEVYRDEAGHLLALTRDVFVSVKRSANRNRLRRYIESIGGSVIEEEGCNWMVRSNDLEADSPLALANHLAEVKGVAFAEPDFIQELKTEALDPAIGRQWYLRNSGQKGGKRGADINVKRAWETTRGSSSVVAGILDTGVDIGHPEFRGQIHAGYDFDNGDHNPTHPNNAHGTACAGIVAASINGKGVIGIAPHCKISAARLSGPSGMNRLIRALQWTARHSDLLCCAWSLAPNERLARALKSLAQSGRNGRGTLAFFPTGNDGQGQVDFPAVLPWVMGVGAFTNMGNRATYSNFGRGLDLLAPSSGGTLAIETTDIRGGRGRNPVGDYCLADQESGFDGTSAACAVASGVAALTLSANPRLRAIELKKVLLKSTVKIEPGQARYNRRGYSMTHGFGCVNAARAVYLVT